MRSPFWSIWGSWWCFARDNAACSLNSVEEWVRTPFELQKRRSFEKRTRICLRKVRTWALYSGELFRSVCKTHEWPRDHTVEALLCQHLSPGCVVTFAWRVVRDDAARWGWIRGHHKLVDLRADVPNEKPLRREARIIAWSGWRESNPRGQLGRLKFYH